MRLHRVARQKQTLGDLAVAQAFDHQVQDGVLPRTQAGVIHTMDRGRGLQRQLFNDAPRNERIDGRAATQHAAQGHGHFHVVTLLEHIAHGACAQGRPDHLLRAPGRDHHDRQTGCLAMQFGNQLNPAAIGQAQVHQRQRDGMRFIVQIGARLGQRAGHHQRIAAIAQLQQQALQAVAHQRVVLYHQYGCRQRKISGERLSRHGVLFLFQVPQLFRKPEALHVTEIGEFQKHDSAGAAMPPFSESAAPTHPRRACPPGAGARQRSPPSR